MAHHLRTYILIIYSLACKNDNIDILELVPVDLGNISLTFKHSLHTRESQHDTFAFLCIGYWALGATVKLILFRTMKMKIDFNKKSKADGMVKALWFTLTKIVLVFIDRVLQDIYVIKINGLLNVQ